MTGTIRVGLVGAGPWATMFHAPMVARAPGVELTSVWARRPEAAAELAGTFGATASASYDELLERCDAVAFAVPPDVQARLAPAAAAAGKHLLLEKPLAFTLADAEAIAAAVDAAGVTTLLMIRNRFEPAVVELLAAAKAVEPRGVVARMTTGAVLDGSPFATPWRLERGALYDLGPHVLDLVEALLGPAVEVRSLGDPTRWAGVTTRHESPAGDRVGQVSLSLTVPGGDDAFHLELVHEGGTLTLGELGTGDPAQVPAAIMAAFVAGIESGESHELDVHRGVVIQRMLAAAGATG